MQATMRAAGAVCLALLLVSGARAAASSDATFVSLEWPESVTLPSVASEAPVVDDEAIQPASDWAAPDDCGAGYSDLSCEDCVSCGEHASGLFGVGWGCEPTWVASVGAVVLHRSRPDPASVVTPPTGTPGVVISGGDFGFGWDAGPDVSLMRRTASGWMFEGRYFNDRDAAATFGIPSITTFRVAGIGVTILGGGPLNARYATKLDSTELNVHAPVNSRVTLLAGFRWVELHDALRVNMATPATFVNWDENNHMYGGQFGTNIWLTRPANPLRVSLMAKGGVYGNDADTRFTSTIVGGTRSAGTAVAFVGEAGLTASYRLTRRLALRGGYEVLWLDNVARASEAAAATTQIAGGTQSTINTDGRLWYNGATTGVEFVW